MLGRFLAHYEKRLQTHPLLTKARASLLCTRARMPAPVRIHFVRLLNGRRVCRVAPQAASSAFVGAAGDIICQLVFEGRDRLDWRRLGIFTLLNGILGASSRIP